MFSTVKGIKMKKKNPHCGMCQWTVAGHPVHGFGVEMPAEAKCKET
jgi:hypothetical protein